MERAYVTFSEDDNGSPSHVVPLKFCLLRLRLIPAKLEQKAPVPECVMRIVTEEDHGHGEDGTEVNVVDLGQPMRIEWSLIPESGYFKLL